MAATSAVIDIAESSDEENNNTNLAVTIPRRKPRGMDAASWKMIQQLQFADNTQRVNDDDVQVVSSPKKRKSRRLAAAAAAEGSLALAKKLQAEEDERRHRQEKRQKEQETEDATQAALLQQKFQAEDERVAKIHRPTKKQVIDELQPCQQQAVSYVQGKAKAKHEEALPLLQKRVASLGFTDKDLTQCLDYIRDDAPIVIHLKEATLPLLVGDTHYRNLFETSKSGGSNNPVGRRQWEKDMFGVCYDRCTPFERPKYGCLNVTGDVQGVLSARNHYGQCFLLLHQHVRHRATFFDKDSGGFVSPSHPLATSEYYAHILQGYSDTDLKAVIHVASTARVGGAPSTCAVYKEVQVHGPVCLVTDVQALSIPGKEKGASAKLKKDVLAFQRKANCNILWQGDLLNPAE